MAERRAIVGLGNPGPRYEGTRHNIGFVVVDALGEVFRAPVTASAHGALWSRAELVGFGEVFLAKPQTYMNCSGEPLVALLEDWELPETEVLVVHDEMDLDLGRLKLKRGGGTGGHRGLQSIEQQTGSRDFYRLRFGVGRPEDGRDTADHVLDAFSESEREPLQEATRRAVQGVRDWLRLDFQAAMKHVNTGPEKPVESDGSGC